MVLISYQGRILVGLWGNTVSILPSLPSWKNPRMISLLVFDIPQNVANTSESSGPFILIQEDFFFGTVHASLIKVGNLQRKTSIDSP